MAYSGNTGDGAARKALFTCEGDGYRPTVWARGPWDPKYLHGGPSAVLLAHALEAECGDPQLFLARMTLDLFRPVPYELLHTEARTLRSGNRIKVVDATVSWNGAAVARASGVFLRRTGGVEWTSNEPRREPLPPWQSVTEWNPLGRDDEPGELFHRAVEMRMLTKPHGGGSMSAWVRTPFELTPGLPFSPFQRVAAVSDFVNAMGMMSRVPRGDFINSDLSLYLFREAAGEWVCMESVGRGDQAGVATSNVNLHDEHGLIGSVAACCVANDFR